MSQESKDPRPQTQMGAGIGAGIAIGAGIGVALDNIPVGIAIGLAIGAGQGAALSQSGGQGRPLAYNVTTVNATDTVGVIFVGVLSLILLIALLRAQAHNRKLRAQLAQPCSDDPGGS